MLKVEKLIELVASEASINEVREKILWKELYALPDRMLLKVKQAMETDIRVEEASMTRHVPHCFSRDKQPEKSLKCGRLPK